MNTYNVTIELSITKDIAVYASSKDEAVEGAMAMFFEAPEDDENFNMKVQDVSIIEDE